MIVTQLLPGHHRLFGWEKKNWTGDKSSFSVTPHPLQACWTWTCEWGLLGASFTQNGHNKMSRRGSRRSAAVRVAFRHECKLELRRASDGRPITEQRVTSQRTENLYSATADGAQELPQHTWPPPLKVDNQYPLHRHADNSSSLCNQP